MNAKIVVIKGDGIGPETVSEAMRALAVIGKRFGHTFQLQEYEAGGCAIDHSGSCLPDDTLAACSAQLAAPSGTACPSTLCRNARC